MTPEQLGTLFEVAAGNFDGDFQRYMPLVSYVLIKGDQGSWVLTERGRAFVDHVCSLPLPEQVMVWAIGGSAPPPVAVRGVSMADLREAGFTGVGPDGEGAPPVPAAPASRLPRIEIPTDPAEVRRLAIQYMNNGMGVGETAEILGVTFEQADAYFLGK